MKKYIVVFDGFRFSKSACDYAISISRRAGAHLVGIFLEDAHYTSYSIYELVQAKGGVIGSSRRKFDRKDAKQRATSVQRFLDACSKSGIEHSVHRDRDNSLRDLIHESIYADLLIIDGRETFRHHPEKRPTAFIHDLLCHVRCPVIVVPSIFREIDRAVLLFDGQPSSVYAIKSFVNTIPALTASPASVLSVKGPLESAHITDNRLVKEYLKRHFTDVDYTVTRGRPEEEIPAWLSKQADAGIVVLGAYDRSAVSRWFRKSLADILMQQVKLPIFIAHSRYYGKKYN